MLIGPAFLTIEDVIETHTIFVNTSAGNTGIRDMNALESAVSQAKATFEGAFLHSFPFGMGAAYGFHICQNQAFVDGNKRTAAMSMIKFLGLNGYALEVGRLQLRDTILAIANHDMSKEGLEVWLSDNCLAQNS